MCMWRHGMSFVRRHLTWREREATLALRRRFEEDSSSCSWLKLSSNSYCNQKKNTYNRRHVLTTRATIKHTILCFRTISRVDWLIKRFLLRGSTFFFSDPTTSSTCICSVCDTIWSILTVNGSHGDVLNKNSENMAGFFKCKPVQQMIEKPWKVACI